MSKTEALKILHRTPEQAIEQKDSDNPALQWGRAMEAEAKANFSLDTWLNIDECGFYPVDDWLGASPDGLIKSEDAIIEIKCPYGIRKDKEPKFKTAFELEHYYIQMQIEMHCTGTKKCYFYQWTPHGSQTEIVYYSEHDTKVALGLLKAIWQQQMQNMSDRDAEYLRWLVSVYQKTQQNIKRDQEALQATMDKIIKATGGIDTIVDGIAVRKVSRAGSVSYAKAIKDHLPDLDLEPYRGKSSEYWRIG